MSLTTINPAFVHVAPPVISGEMHACGWECTTGGALRNYKTRWRVGAVITWRTIDLHKEVVWVATPPAQYLGTQQFDTWQEAVNYADVTGALES
jgi:hypothetical protein